MLSHPFLNKPRVITVMFAVRFVYPGFTGTCWFVQHGRRQWTIPFIRLMTFVPDLVSYVTLTHTTLVADVWKIAAGIVSR